MPLKQCNWRVRHGWETNTLLTSSTWLRKRRQQRKTGRIITTICMEKRGCHRLLIRAQNKYHLPKSWHKEYDFFFPNTGHVFYLLIFFQHFNRYVFIFSHEGSPQNRYVCVKMLKKWVNKKHDQRQKKKNHTLHVMTFVSGVCLGL